jgi:hypothetical protein
MNFPNFYIWERRQTRKILLPFLFTLYLNDLETFLENNNVTGLKTLSDELEELGYYVKLFVIMYANDTALLAKSASNLQNKVESVPSILHQMET